MFHVPNCGFNKKNFICHVYYFVLIKHVRLIAQFMT